MQMMIGHTLYSATETETEKKVEVIEKVADEKNLILFNDEVNTFDFVIESLMEVCDHNINQAEQCTLIVHYKGKCNVKKGTFDDLKPMCEELLKRGLTAEIH